MSKYNCEKCDDRKYILNSAGKWVGCTCLNALKLQSKLIESNIPPIFRDYTWTDFFKSYKRSKNKWHLASRIVNEVIQKKKCKFLYIRGNSGSGKQAFVSLLLKDMINKGLSCRFVSMHDLIQLEFDKDKKDELRKIYESYDVVCLRIGTVVEHKLARYVLEKFYISRRNNNRYCIFTSRIDMATKSNIYGLEMQKFLSDGRRVLSIEMRGGDA